MRIPLESRWGQLVAYVEIDEEDADIVANRSWRLMKAQSGLRYAVSTHVLMHRLITNAPQGLETDHIDGNGLNNRRSNLRVVTHAQNHQNRRAAYNAVSPFRGVYRERDGRWRAQVRLHGVKYCLGSFSDEQAAAEVAREWRARYMPYAVN